MFCLMDVSASMDEDKKDLAKRFFTLLYLFLTRKYERGRAGVHPPHRRCGGGRRGHVLPRYAIAAAPSCCRRSSYAEKIRQARYAIGWNIYARPGVRRRRFRRRSGKSARFLREHLLPAARYFAYLETPAPNASEQIASLWAEYERVAAPTRNLRDAARVAARPDLSGLPRAVPQGGAHEPRAPQAIAAARGAPWPSRAAPTGTSTCSSNTTTAIAERRSRIRARHLSEPDRDHHVRADARRLCLQRAADRLSATGPMARSSSATSRRIAAGSRVSPTRSSSTPIPASPT